MTGYAAAQDTGVGREFRLRRGIAVEHFDDRSLLLLGDTDQLVTLNRVGGDLIETMYGRIQERRFGLQDLARTIADRYELSLKQACREAENVLADWVTCGIVERCGADTGEKMGGKVDE